mmetsp:Transcript_17377/g.49015  ORF Transcript_17377/g.49015 Transcript_17377/m.49015 type:complete len:232 (-) Transcript_17377:695-1390(-)
MRRTFPSGCTVEQLSSFRCGRTPRRQHHHPQRQTAMPEELLRRRPALVVEHHHPTTVICCPPIASRLEMKWKYARSKIEEIPPVELSAPSRKLQYRWLCLVGSRKVVTATGRKEMAEGAKLQQRKETLKAAKIKMMITMMALTTRRVLGVHRFGWSPKVPWKCIASSFMAWISCSDMVPTMICAGRLSRHASTRHPTSHQQNRKRKTRKNRPSNYSTTIWMKVRSMPYNLR